MRYFENDSNFWMKSNRVTIQMKGVEQYFLFVLVIMLSTVALILECVDEISESADHLNEG